MLIIRFLSIAFFDFNFPECWLRTASSGGIGCDQKCWKTTGKTAPGDPGFFCCLIFFFLVILWKQKKSIKVLVVFYFLFFGIFLDFPEDTLLPIGQFLIIGLDLFPRYCMRCKQFWCSFVKGVSENMILFVCGCKCCQEGTGVQSKPAITVGEIWNILKCTVDGRNPANQLIWESTIIHRVLHISGGAGFLPSTVFKYMENHWTALSQSWLLETWRWRLFWGHPGHFFKPLILLTHVFRKYSGKSGKTAQNRKAEVLTEVWVELKTEAWSKKKVQTDTAQVREIMGLPGTQKKARIPWRNGGCSMDCFVTPPPPPEV